MLSYYLEVEVGSIIIEPRKMHGTVGTGPLARKPSTSTHCIEVSYTYIRVLINVYDSS